MVLPAPSAPRNNTTCPGFIPCEADRPSRSISAAAATRWPTVSLSGIDDLSQALELTSEELKEDEKILKGIVSFGNIDVKEIMKSRIDVVSADISAKLDQLIAIAVESGYSRIPIYKHNFDQVKGILYIKDLLPHIQKSSTFNRQ